MRIITFDFFAELVDFGLQRFVFVHLSGQKSFRSGCLVGDSLGRQNVGIPPLVFGGGEMGGDDEVFDFQLLARCQGRHRARVHRVHVRRALREPLGAQGFCEQKKSAGDANVRAKDDMRESLDFKATRPLLEMMEKQKQPGKPVFGDRVHAPQGVSARGVFLRVGAKLSAHVLRIVIPELE